MEDHHLLYQDLSKWSRATPVPCSKDFFPYLFPHLPRQLLFLLIPWLKSLFFIPQSYFLLKKKILPLLKVLHARSFVRICKPFNFTVVSRRIFSKNNSEYILIYSLYFFHVCLTFMCKNTFGRHKHNIN